MKLVKMKRGVLLGSCAFALLVSLSCRGGTIQDAPVDMGAALSDGGTDASTDTGASIDAQVATPDAGQSPDGGEAQDAGFPPGDSGVDLTAPQLVSTSPEAGSEIDVRSPIQLQYSEPLAPEGIDTNIFQVTVDGTPLAIEVRLLSDQTTVEITLAAMSALPATIRVSIGTGITDLSGNAFGGAQVDFVAPAYFSYPGIIAEPDAAEIIMRSGGPWMATRSAGRAELWRWSAPDEMAESETLTRPGGAAVAGPWINQTLERVWVTWVEDRAGALFVEWSVYESGSPRQDLRPLVLDLSTDATQVSVGTAGGRPTVSYLAGASPDPYALQQLADGAWSTLDLPTSVPPTGRPAMAAVDHRLWWAAPFGNEIRTWARDGDQWSRLEDIATSTPTATAITGGREGRGVVGWIANVGSQRSLHLTTLDGAGSSPPTPAANLRIDAGIEHFSFGEDEQGRPTATWTESTASGRQGFAAHFDGTFWRHQRGVLEAEAGAIRHAAMATDEFGRPVYVWWNAGVFHLRFANGASTASGPTVPSSNVAGCAPLPADGPAFPVTLTETGCFDDQGLTPKIGIVPYSTTSQLWSDGAVKRRWFALPPGEAVDYNATADGAWRFPVGTVFIKEFGFEHEGERAVVETRILTKRCDSGCASPWQGYTYRWAPDASIATLQPADTAEVVAWTVGGRTFDHIYPSRPQCLFCHSDAPGYVLGVSTTQLNRRWRYGSKVGNQIETLVASGVLFGVPTNAVVSALTRAVRHSDPHAAPLPTRARSYLHANCSSCHRQGGMGPWLNFLSPLQGPASLCEQIVPQDPQGSPLWQRMATRERVGGGINPMPPLATGEVDDAALDVISEWIRQTTFCP